MSKPQASSNTEPELHHRFWGTRIQGGKSLTLTLTNTELHLTQVCLIGKGSAQVIASTPTISDIPICILSSSGVDGAHKLLDLNFFPEDETITFKVEGNAAVSLAGSIAIIGALMEVSDDEESDVEEPAPKKSKTAKGAAVIEEEDEQEEDEEEEDEEEEEEEEEVEAPPKKRGREPESKKAEPKKAEPAKEAAPIKKAEPEQKPSTKAEGDFKPMAGGKVYFRDDRVGKGPAASKGKRVRVAYKGTLKNGKQFDASKNFEFRLGAGEVIKGWDVGVAGMAVGGKRTLIIHPDYAYGKSGAGKVIPGNATLKFEVELLKA